MHRHPPRPRKRSNLSPNLNRPLVVQNVSDQKLYYIQTIDLSFEGDNSPTDAEGESVAESNASRKRQKQTHGEQPKTKKKAPRLVVYGEPFERLGYWMTKSNVGNLIHASVCYSSYTVNMADLIIEIV